MAGSKQNQYALYAPSTDDQFTTMELLRPMGRGEITEQFGTRKNVYVNGVDGTFEVFGQEEEPPGDSPTIPLTFFQESDIKLIERFASQGRVFPLQVRLYDCASIDNPTAWNRIWQLPQIKVSNRKFAEGPTVRAGGAFVESTLEGVALAMIDVAQLALSAYTTTETEDMLAIDGLKDLSTACGAGYPGPDKVLVMSSQAAAGAKANVYFSLDGGATQTVITADPGGNDEHLGAIVVRPLSTGFRIVVARTVTDAAAPGEIWYATPTAFDATTIAAVTWTSVNVGSVNAEFIKPLSLFWPEFNRMYAGNDVGDIYLSTNQGESWTKIYDGVTANDVNRFAAAPDGSIWAGCLGGVLLYESVSNRNSFSVKTSPNTDEIFSLAVANDGTIFAGQGTSIFRNNNNATTAGGWENLKNFGSGFKVVEIWFEGENKLKGGDGQIIRIVVDDTAPNDGSVWQSVDWGESWQQVLPALANDGYNAAYHSRYGNKAVIVGDDNPLAVVQLLSQA